MAWGGSGEADSRGVRRATRRSPAETDRDDQGDSAPADAPGRPSRPCGPELADPWSTSTTTGRASQSLAARPSAFSRAHAVADTPCRASAAADLVFIEVAAAIVRKACSVSTAPHDQKMMNELVAQHPSSNHALFTPSSNHPSSNPPTLTRSSCPWNVGPTWRTRPRIWIGRWPRDRMLIVRELQRRSVGHRRASPNGPSAA